MYAELAVAYPTVHAKRCVRYRFRYSACSRCAEACPHQALSLSEEGAVIDWDHCQNCALCASACRTGVFQAANLPRMELLKQAIGAERWTFVCAPSGRSGNAVVPCLGALDPSLLAYLASRGVAVELVGTEHCARCSHAPQGKAQLALNLEGLSVLRDALGGETWAPVTVPHEEREDSSHDLDTPARDRRQFFRRVFGKAATRLVQAENGAPIPTPLKAIRAAAPFLPGQRELLQALWPKAPAPITLAPHPALPLAQLTVAPGCTACEACARVCPTGALQVGESTQSWELVFRFARCVSCEACLEACQPGVLRDGDSITVLAPYSAEGNIVFALPCRRCERCSRVFIPTEREADICTVCADDGESLTAIFG